MKSVNSCLLLALLPSAALAINQPITCANITITSITPSGPGCAPNTARTTLSNKDQTALVTLSALSKPAEACKLAVVISYPVVNDDRCSLHGLWTVVRKGSTNGAGTSLSFPMDVSFANRTWGSPGASDIPTATANDFIGSYDYALGGAAAQSNSWTIKNSNSFVFSGAANSLDQSFPVGTVGADSITAPKGWPTVGRKTGSSSKRQENLAVAPSIEEENLEYNPAALPKGIPQLTIEQELASISHGLGSSVLWGKRQAGTAPSIEASGKATGTMNIAISIPENAKGASLSSIEISFETGINDNTLF